MAASSSLDLVNKLHEMHKLLGSLSWSELEILDEQCLIDVWFVRFD
jgi:hypothetical protein